MKVARPFFVLLLLCAYSGPLAAITMGENPQMTLHPPPSSSTPLLGIPFGASFQEASTRLAQMGLHLLSKEALDKERLSFQLTFDALPSTLGPKDGELRVLFFRNRLIRADLVFKPEYKCFLQVREHFLGSLGARYSIDRQETVMERHLRAHLAALPRGAFNTSSEHAVLRSLLNGKTFFFYQLRDSKKQFNANLSYHSVSVEGGEKQALLQVHLSLLEDMKSFRKFLYSQNKAEG